MATPVGANVVPRSVSSSHRPNPGTTLVLQSSQSGPGKPYIDDIYSSVVEDKAVFYFLSRAAKKLVVTRDLGVSYESYPMDFEATSLVNAMCFLIVISWV